MDDGLCMLVGEAAGYRNGDYSYPFAVLAAESHISLADSATTEGRIRRVRAYYESAMRAFVDARQYGRAFDIAEERGLLPEIKYISHRRIHYLTAIGSPEDCAVMENLMCPKKRPKNKVDLKDNVQV
ncbi:hypothetical protein J4234_07200 [Candidatus Woesearchaeota archaeon]|nr:hypothetical protein [Candidatus Woesearchaeota archaeon]